MEYYLDIRTLSFTSSLISLILCICMIYVFRNRKTYDGFIEWTTASMLNFLGLLLLSLRNYLPDFITIVIANTLIVAAVGFVAHGIEIFSGGARKKWLFMSLSMVLFVSFLHFTFYSPNVNARIVIISVILAILYSYSAYIVKKNIPHVIKTQNTLLQVVFTVQAIWFLLRIIPTALVEGHIVDFMQASLFQALAVVVFWGGNLFVAIGLIVLNSQRVEFDLLRSMDEVKTLRGFIPICASCKKIRDDKGIWEQIEIYIRDHSDAEFSHSICPECARKLYPEIDVVT